MAAARAGVGGPPARSSFRSGRPVHQRQPGSRPRPSCSSFATICSTNGRVCASPAPHGLWTAWG